MANALELLAKEYEAEESQTLTTALEPSEFSRFKPSLDNNSQGSDDSDENTVIEEYEETIIQNNDTYIDKLISDKQHSGTRYSESGTITTSPNFAMSPASSYMHQQSSLGFNRQMTSGKSVPPLQPQMSQDFLLIVENLQKELHQKDKALEIIAKQLKQKQSDHDKMVNKNEALNKQIKQLQKLQTDNDNKNSSTTTEIESIRSQLIEKSQIIIEKNDNIDKLNDKINGQNIMIQSLTKEIETYQSIEEWLEMQMKWDSNGSVTSRQNTMNDEQTPRNRPKLTVKALEEWKFSIISNQQKGFSVDTENNDNYMNEDEEKQIEQQPTPKGYETIDDKDKNKNKGDKEEDDDEQEPKDYNEETALLSSADDGDGKSKSKKKKKKKRDKKKYAHRTQINANGEAENAINTDNSGCCIPWFSQGQ